MDILTSVVSVGWVFLILATGMAESDQCRFTPNGTCVNLDEYYCPLGHKLANRGCGFKETCCFPLVHKEPVFKYGDKSCGVTSTNWDARIVGGEKAYISEYPWTASIQKSGQPVCGGSIISDQWILTAAHCVDTQVSTITVVLGTSKSRIAWSDYKKRYEVSKIIKHADFSMKSTGYDIALVKLTRAIDLGGTMARSVCLPDTDEDFTDHVCVATGWGYTEEPEGEATSEGSATYLRAATLPVVSESRCAYYTGIRSEDTLCAGYSNGGEDTCQGDSGGPLVCRTSKGLWTQAGIVSTGIGCGRSKEMGIYTKVAAHRKWIEYAMDRYQ